MAISSPANGTTYTSAQTVSIDASATDAVGVTKVEFYDGATLKGTDTTAPYGYSWSFSGADNGPHNWTAKAYDAARSVTVLFGGGTVPANGDTWEWNGSTWSVRARSGPSPRGGHAVAFDTARANTVLFGGRGGSGLQASINKQRWRFSRPFEIEEWTPGGPERC